MYTICKSDFVVKRTSRGDYIVHVKGRDNHGHFKRKNGCDKLINIICKGFIPNNKYFRIAAKRILTEEEYQELRERRKDKYINVPRKR